MIEFVSAFCLDGKVDRRRVYRRWLDSDSRGLVVGGLSVVLASRFGFPFEDLVLTVFVMVCFSPSFCQVLLWTAVRSIRRRLGYLGATLPPFCVRLVNTSGGVSLRWAWFVLAALPTRWESRGLQRGPPGACWLESSREVLHGGQTYPVDGLIPRIRAKR